MTYFEYLETLMTEKRRMGKNLLTYYGVDMQARLHAEALTTYHTLDRECDQIIQLLMEGKISPDQERTAH